MQYPQGPWAPQQQQPQGLVNAPPEWLARNGQCPRCQGFNIDTPSYTWWGGVLGPKMFKHRVCRACGLGFNGETGLSNRNKIIAYQVVIIAICLLGAAAYFLSA